MTPARARRRVAMVSQRFESFGKEYARGNRVDGLVNIFGVVNQAAIAPRNKRLMVVPSSVSLSYSRVKYNLENTDFTVSARSLVTRKT